MEGGKIYMFAQKLSHSYKQQKKKQGIDANAIFRCTEKPQEMVWSF